MSKCKVCKKENIFPRYSMPGYCDACAEKVTPNHLSEQLPRGFVSLRDDGGMTHLILWKKYADTPSVEYMPVSEHTKEREELREMVESMRPLLNTLRYDCEGDDEAVEALTILERIAERLK